MLRERYCRVWSVTVQHRWMDTEPVVCIAIGGWDSVGPGLLEVVLQETTDPTEAVETALRAAQQRGLAVDLETDRVYGDHPDATAEGTGYTAEELHSRADDWLDQQPECWECGDIADLRWAVDWETECNYCSQTCAESAYIREHTEEVLV